MPFKSKAQQRFMFAAEDKGDVPKGTAEEWAHETPNIKKLPEKVKQKKTAAELADIICDGKKKDDVVVDKTVKPAMKKSAVEMAQDIVPQDEENRKELGFFQQPKYIGIPAGASIGMGAGQHAGAQIAKLMHEARANNQLARILGLQRSMNLGRGAGALAGMLGGGALGYGLTRSIPTEYEEPKTAAELCDSVMKKNVELKKVDGRKKFQTHLNEIPTNADEVVSKNRGGILKKSFDWSDLRPLSMETSEELLKYLGRKVRPFDHAEQPTTQEEDNVKTSADVQRVLVDVHAVSTRPQGLLRKVAVTTVDPPLAQAAVSPAWRVTDAVTNRYYSNTAPMVPPLPTPDSDEDGTPAVSNNVKDASTYTEDYYTNTNADQARDFGVPIGTALGAIGGSLLRPAKPVLSGLVGAGVGGAAGGLLADWIGRQLGQYQYRKAMQAVQMRPEYAPEIMQRDMPGYQQPYFKGAGLLEKTAINRAMHELESIDPQLAFELRARRAYNNAPEDFKQFSTIPGAHPQQSMMRSAGRHGFDANDVRQGQLTRSLNKATIADPQTLEAINYPAKTSPGALNPYLSREGAQLKKMMTERKLYGGMLSAARPQTPKPRMLAMPAAVQPQAARDTQDLSKLLHFV